MCTQVGKKGEDYIIGVVQSVGMFEWAIVNGEMLSDYVEWGNDGKGMCMPTKTLSREGKKERNLKWYIKDVE